MIIWGTRYDLIGEFNNVPLEKCKVCLDINKPIYKAEQAYFRLYGMSLFPTFKLYFKSCTACSVKLKVKSIDINLHTVKNALSGSLKFKYIWGWLILLPIIAGTLYLFLSI
ncbi:MAG: hypothetical protein COA97_03025 [Flavobacteriales bacterium]|nr:MAG: hypothetical protein COA97_03025 [Flavobacteriales bacterium]